jgi:hypothetical protein
VNVEKTQSNCRVGEGGGEPKKYINRSIGNGHGWISFSHEGGSKEKKPSIRGGWEDSEDWP